VLHDEEEKKVASCQRSCLSFSWKVFVKLKFLFAAYGAAGISFLASLLRDYVVINFTNQGKEFFQLLYVVSMAAGFGVNVIAGGGARLGRTGLAILSLLGVVVILVMLPLSSRTPNTVILLGCILLLWIAGAQLSRVLVERGWVFSGRVREAIASVVLTALVLAGIGVEPSFLVSAFCGTAFSLLMWKSSPHSADSKPHGDALYEIKNLFASIILTNFTTFSITYWALLQTARQGDVFGYETHTVVRFSMYLYQVLTIGAIVLVSLRGRLIVSKVMALCITATGLLFVVSLFLPLEFSIFITPLAAAVLHYGAVFFLHQLFYQRSI
jgi:hypothetical protein